MSRNGRHSCNSATETLEWINSINEFLRPYRPLLDAHVVNFFKDRLWETVDKQWMDCLREESVENLLQIPSGVVQDYWPASLKDFILSLKSLVFPREQEELPMRLPNFHMAPLSSVLTQGMNLKKRHEVEILAATVDSIAKNVGSRTVIDVGAGQGYLAQVLSFQHQLSVFAMDASSHHGMVTSARAERIKKHYAAKMTKSQNRNKNLNVPQTVTCCVLSSNMLKALRDALSCNADNDEPPEMNEEGVRKCLVESELCKTSADNLNVLSSLVLAGLHACGDLSVTMLRTFLECDEVKAVVSIGCCYNLLSEEGFGSDCSHIGFPMSGGVKLANLLLGKSARDLACQSAERWNILTADVALQNFELHAFRAAFQMVLHRYYPEVLATNPSIGRQGKALRRQQMKKALQIHLQSNCFSVPFSQKQYKMEGCSPIIPAADVVDQEQVGCVLPRDDKSCSTFDSDAISPGISSNHCSRSGGVLSIDQYSLFERFCKSGLCRLGLIPSKDVDFLGSWNQTQPFAELIGPYWSLRAAFGPLIETLLLLDRLLFLQEQGSSVKAMMLPLFDPTLSPRNVAIIAQKN